MTSVELSQKFSRKPVLSMIFLKSTCGSHELSMPKKFQKLVSSLSLQYHSVVTTVVQFLLASKNFTGLKIFTGGLLSLLLILPLDK